MKPRLGARVLVLDQFDRVLLLHGSNPERNPPQFWMTPGGGLEDGEGPRAAALRELYEETGLRVCDDDLAGPVATRIGRWMDIHQHDHCYVVRTPTFRPSNEGHDADERVVLAGGYKWWSVQAIEASPETIYPDGLADLLRLLARGVPDEPVVLPPN